MVSRDERRIARELVDAKRAREGQRTRQIPHTSVELDNGESAGIVDAATDASDARALSEVQADQLGDLTDITDTSTIENTFLPERLAPSAGSSKAAFDVAVEAAVRVYEALTKADTAMDAAARSERTALGLVRRYSETEPEPPEGGWLVGAEWVQSVNGVPRYVFVWDGVGWTRAQYLADEILIPGEDGAIRLGNSVVAAPNMAAGALDAYTVNALQMYGGYIEAPVIASSDKLGSGANALDDPTFVSSIDEAWVASGHLGDPAATQLDNIKWNQNWVMQNVSGGPTTWKNDGSVAAMLEIQPLARRVGTLLFPNFSYVPPTRNINNPFTFTNTNWSNPHSGGQYDPSTKAVGSPAAPLPGVAKTSYLTNSAVVPVVAGERWNARITFTPVPTAQTQFVVGIWVELIDAVAGGVVWSRPLTSDEIRGGNLNAWWDCDFTGDVKYRIKATYTAGGGMTPKRVVVPGSWAGKWPVSGPGNGSTWVAPSGMVLAYGDYPYSGFQYLGPIWDGRIGLNIDVRNAVFAKVEPQKGWRLTEDGGLELFNSLGAKTGNIDGENNFLAGRFATAESGMRWEVQGERVAFFDAAGLLVGGMRRAGDGIQIFGPISYQGDTDWITIPLLSEFEIMSGVTPRYKVSNGTLYLRGRVRRKTGADLGTAYTSVTPAGVIPDLTGIRDSAGSARSVPGSGVNGEGLVRITDNGSIQCAAQTGIAHSFLTADWLVG